jgi:hypothetical protein
MGLVQGTLQAGSLVHQAGISKTYEQMRFQISTLI